jgi:hypothetical protein
MQDLKDYQTSLTLDLARKVDKFETFLIEKGRIQEVGNIINMIKRKKKPEEDVDA